MKALSRGLGLVLILAAASAGVAELFYSLAEGGYEPLTLAELWTRFGEGSLRGFRAFVEGSLGPALWAPIRWALALPAWLALLVPGLVFVYLGRSRERGGSSFR